MQCVGDYLCGCVEGDFGWWAYPGEFVELLDRECVAAVLDGTGATDDAGEPVGAAFWFLAADVGDSFGGAVEGDVDVGCPGGEEGELVIVPLLLGLACPLPGRMGEVE